jgi:2-polyprenyl-3-methyl-5-hydroxy-6-metoxy-1,4-benzoquinol methylase
VSFILINRAKSILKSKLYREKIPFSLSNNFRELNPGYYSLMLESLKKYHYTEERGYNENYLDTKHGKKSLQDTIYNRIEEVRHRIIPWLESCRPLSNLNIIEVGSGSGTGTIALAEQAKSVIALDIDSEILKVCEDRCKILHLENIEYHCMELSNYSYNNSDNLDAIIFYASLEHMTLKQRISALRTAWEILPIGGLIIIIDTPNCLFFYDGHTSGLPFHHWISDELAYRYVEVNPNSIFRSELFLDQLNNAKMDEFISWGRSVSYHDLEVSTKKSINSLNFLDSLSSYENKKYYNEKKLLTLSRKIRFKKESVTDRYIKLMSEYQPQIDPAFFSPYLNIILEKH